MRGRPVQLVLLFACLAALCWAIPARAATLVPVGDFDQPIYVTSDPGNPDRLLVAEREGRVLLVEGSSSALLADIEPLVECCESERGLLSIAPAPGFAATGRFFAFYTGTAAAGAAVGDIHVDSLRPGPLGGLIREPILTISHSTRANHNGGQLQFGPDGYLYLSTGDGGGIGDPDDNAQDLGSLLGKILRIEPRPGETPAYAIPPDNPFLGAVGAIEEIWAYGLRNPWRFSFDQLSGRMVIGDVGQGSREEVDLGLAGANYGWDCREGSIAYTGLNAPVSCPATGFTDPVFDYPHDDPGGDAAFGCAITGGYVVRDPTVPELFGRYLYADFCEGELRSLVLPAGPGGTANDDRSEGLSVSGPVSLGEDSAGRVYVVSGEGPIYRLVGPPVAGAPVPPPVAGPPRPRPLVLLSARRGRGRFVKLIVRLLPCDLEPGGTVYLNRNGRPFRHKRLSHRCVTRFRVRVGRRPVRFRAFFEDQRSQVRKIAFAKPRP
ncbi:MAG TPA: PQQ-dependent sugar dehydrogenase [Solirubrobacterales bacterium]|nr:PQQ-dependent sugar dehydrogenase [Solirubrobacterales bacterium]